MRLKALNKFDRFLNWSTSAKLKTFALMEPLKAETFEVEIIEMESFADHYGYFSPIRPIVGKVSTSEEDLKLVCCVLKALFEKGDDLEYLELATAEILAKALAYRDLKEGQKIRIPTIINGNIRFENYTVDRVFNLWNGMPAFGLFPELSEVEPILLFRGTDFSLDSQRGWASLMSDLDLAGPGLSTFQRAREPIHEWLSEVSKSGKKSKVIGFSLGGALAAYTFIYENEWIAKKGSMAFCAPGVDESVIRDWEKLPIARKEGFITYVNEGDIVSKVGEFFGTVYVLSAEKKLLPVSAHTKLMSAEPTFFKALVDVEQENHDR